MSNYTRVYFEGLGIDFDLPSVAFTIFGYEIHFYGIIIALGFTLAVLYGGMMAHKWKMSLDGMTDVLIWGTIFGIICARGYYVIFEWSYYKEHLAEIPMIWHGGLAIYGGIIGALIGAAIGCKVGKINFPNLLDLGGIGLLIGQGIGRWGNFFNQEAFGINTTTSPFRMWSVKIKENIIANADTIAAKGMEVDPDLPVHPTFLYESVWCIVGFFILNYILRHKRKFKGEVFMLYGIWYGLERAVVEGLRTDSLYIGDTTLRVSQLLSMIIVVIFAVALIVCFVKYKKGTLWKGLILESDNKAVSEEISGENQTESTEEKEKAETLNINEKENEKAEIENGTDN